MWAFPSNGNPKKQQQQHTYTDKSMKSEIVAPRPPIFVNKKKVALQQSWPWKS